MSGDIPPWMDDVPPSSDVAGVSKGKTTGRGAPTTRTVPSATAEDVGDFYAWLAKPQTALELKKILPHHLDVDLFLATCKEAALSNARLLAPALRPSLLRAVVKAARQGLRPDGKEGALVPRYSMEDRVYTVSFQPMVWGLTKLGRLTGAIKTIRPIIVFQGETFEMEEGDEPRWIHKISREIVDDAYQALYGGMTAGDHPRLLVNAEDFFQRVSCAYCIITSVDGTVTKRWMSARRIDLIRKQQGKNTPWYGPFVDEMIIKTVILYTAKHLDLDISNPATRAFREALLDDVGTDDFEALAPPDPAKQVALGHETKLQQFENLFGAKKENADLVPEEKSDRMHAVDKMPPWDVRVRQKMAGARSSAEIESLSNESWFRDGLVAARAEDTERADGLLSELVQRADALRATPVD